MPKKIDMIGKIFGRLTVYAESVKKGKRISYRCGCTCGNFATVLGEDLRSGSTKSCGCRNIEKIKERFTKHGMCKTKTYHTWIDMVQRCTNPNNSKYSDYGGRNISVCKEWLDSFETFYKDMGERPKGLTIERKNNELGYFKENCCWDTYSVQARNRRLKSTNTSGVTGVSLNKRTKKYCAYISADCKFYTIGYFDTLEQAVEARFQAEQKYWI